jgi:gamma-glutamyltranspeptidase / glutathione hydrolase
MLPAAVAAGHPATAAAGLEILEAGGSAADAAVAACLASCVAETVMTGLLGGGHGIYWDAAAGRARNLDCFCAVPSGSGGDLLHLRVPFGEELVHYAVGPASCAVPGVPAGLDALWRAHGRLPWAALCEPALRLARAGVAMPPAHVACLAMLEAVMTMHEGGRIYAPAGRLLRDGETLDQPGLVAALELVADEGAASFYAGSIAESLLALMEEREGVVTGADLVAYEAVWGEPVEVVYAGTRFLTRGGLADVAPTLERLPALSRLGEPARTLALLDALAGEPGPETHTTNLVTADADGNACVLTTSLGLGSGDWLPGLDLHLNSMLGEVDLLVGALEPGARMQSMMAPSVAVAGDGPVLAIGSAGGTRLRTALVSVASGVLDESLAPQDAVDRPRVHPAGEVVNAEPGVDESALAELERRGLSVRRWPAKHHYFGGTSLIARSGPAADARRSGASGRA